MVESCRVFTYSPQNIYAKDYYKACDEFDTIRNEVIAYEQSTDDRTSAKYQEMMSKFKYWDAEVPRRSNIAGAEEDRIRIEKMQKQKGVGENLDILG